MDGCAVAEGLELACFTHIRLTNASAQLGFFARRMGVSLGESALNHLRQLVGLSVANKWVLTGGHITANEAQSCGFLANVCKDGTGRFFFHTKNIRHVFAYKIAGRSLRVRNPSVRVHPSSY